MKRTGESHRYLIIMLAAIVIVGAYTMARGIEGFILGSIAFFGGFWVTWTSEPRARTES